MWPKKSPAWMPTWTKLERLLKKGGEIGKRLDFLIQELHREANTLGSKSATLELTRISVRHESADRANARASAKHRITHGKTHAAITKPTGLPMDPF